eukprot:8134723-Lingulodinium_polyedra.AAC.1
MARVAENIDRYASMRLLKDGSLAADAAGTLRTVMAGGTAAGDVARHWNAEGSICPHCKRA